MAIWLDACKPVSLGKSGEALTVRRKGVVRMGEIRAEFTLPRKTSKENRREPYLKPTQVDEENIQRRSGERSFRNSAN